MDSKGTYGHKLGKHMEFNFSEETKLKMEMCYTWQSRRMKIGLI